MFEERPILSPHDMISLQYCVPSLAVTALEQGPLGSHVHLDLFGLNIAAQSHLDSYDAVRTSVLRTRPQLIMELPPKRQEMDHICPPLSQLRPSMMLQQERATSWRREGGDGDAATAARLSYGAWPRLRKAFAPAFAGAVRVCGASPSAAVAGLATPVPMMMPSPFASVTRCSLHLIAHRPELKARVPTAAPNDVPKTVLPCVFFVTTLPEVSTTDRSRASSMAASRRTVG